MNEIFEVVEGNCVCIYELVNDEDSPLPNVKKFNLICKEYIYD